MPKWLARALRMSFIGMGVSLTVMAAIGLWVLDAVFDVSFEHQLGISAAELRPICYVLGAIGILLALFAATVRLPQKWLRAEARRPSHVRDRDQNS
ncbi:MAG: hypothetical protein SynsKO_17660 [Synoicihabitans sp.]